LPKLKEFRDPVHGYISVPEEYCDKIIDTPIFQRLREIEQTGMRVLFPGARHCRFSHSLGTYHLGQKAFRHFARNTCGFFSGVSEKTWAGYEQTFLLACLLHDCAHAPFSHTFEWRYEWEPTAQTSRLRQPLLAAANDKAFEKDYGWVNPAPHEKASAVVVLTHFAQAIREFGGNPLLAARMILGCKHAGPDNDIERLENCLVSLLSDKAVDVDKLDYILRDTWASGVNNSSIDMHRLLSSLTYDVQQCRLAFRKSAMSVLQSVVDGRNYLHRWVFGHHKVIYNQYLLETAIEQLAQIMSPDDPDNFLLRTFSLETFSKDVDVGGGVSFYLPTDHDLTVLLRKYRDTIPEAKEYLFRQHARKALWKTPVEFSLLFPNKTDQEVDFIAAAAKEKLSSMVDGRAADIGFVVERIPEKMIVIQTGTILIQIDGTSYSYDQLFGKPNATEKRNPLYVFAPLECLHRKNELIAALQQLSF
jgi:hypothetical protein